MELALPKSGALFLHESPNLLTPRGEFLGIRPAVPPAVGAVLARGKRADRHWPVFLVIVAARMVKMAATRDPYVWELEFVRYTLRGDEPSKVHHVWVASSLSRI